MTRCRKRRHVDACSRRPAPSSIRRSSRSACACSKHLQTPERPPTGSACLPGGAGLTPRDAGAGASAPRPRPRPARRSPTRPPRAPGCAVDSSSDQRRPKRAGGSRKVSASRHALKSTMNESSTIGSPSRVSAMISAPLRNAPTADASPRSQSRRVIARPSGRNHQTSGAPESSCSLPVRKVARRKIGCARRRAISRRVKASSARARSSSSQSTQLISLSWQYALLLPLWVRAISSPASSIGTPCERRSVARKLRTCRSRSAFTVGVVRLSLDAAVPRPVVRRPVAVALEVRLVVPLVVADEVAQGEAVVARDVVDRRERAPPVRLVEVARAGEPLRERRDGAVAAPEVPHRVAVHPVPLGPEDGEVADLVAALADVPRLGDELHLGEDRVLVDDVEEGREAIDVVELARERRGEVEAEAVDVALGHEVPQRVHDQPQHRRVDGVERVPGAREVLVVPRRVGHRAVVGEVVDAPEGQRRAEVVALGGVVVDDVEDHLDAGAVHRLHEPLELAHLLAVRPRRGVAGVRGEEADRRVAPVVRQAPRLEEVLVGDVVDRQQLDRRDAEVDEVRDRRVGGEARRRCRGGPRARPAAAA